MLLFPRQVSLYRWLLVNYLVISTNVFLLQTLAGLLIWLQSDTINNGQRMGLGVKRSVF